MLPKEVQIILVINKSDLIPPEELIGRSDAYRELVPERDWIVISAKNGDGLDELLNKIVQALPEGPRFYPIDQTTDIFIRDIAAELIREQIFLQMREELPYSTVVVVNEYKERESGIVYIQADIFVERDNHKKMIIGSKGEQLRKIGAAARREIEDMVGDKVFLDLWVKVEPNWRQSERALKRFGFNP
jgi:GTP-binding protein Era